MQAEVELVALRATPASRRRAQVVVIGSALWLWVLVVLLPMVELGLGGVLGATLALAFPLVITLGLGLDHVAFLHRGALGRRASEAVLFGLAPLVLVWALASRAELLPREVLGAVHATLISGAAAAYVATVAHLSTTHALRRDGRPQSLPASAKILESWWPRTIRALLLATSALASLALVAVAPIWSGHAARLARFGIDGADTAALLGAVLGLASGIVVLGVIVAPALRARSSGDRVPSRYGTLGWVVVAALFAILAGIWLSA